MSFRECVLEQISLNFNYERFEDPVIFILNGDSNNETQSMFDSLLEFMVDKTLTSVIDIIIFNNNPAIETTSCKYFIDSFINKVSTIQNYNSIRNIYHLRKSQNETCSNYTKDVKKS